MSTKLFFRVLGFGFLLFVLVMALLFVLSIVTGSDKPTSVPWVGLVVAVVAAAGSLLCSRLLHAADYKQALSFGSAWALMLFALLLIITIPNETVDVVFGNWSTYVVFAGIVIGPLLWRDK